MPLRGEPPYRYWPITERPRLVYPDGKRMACYLGVNVEHFEFGKRAATRAATSANLPVDPLNYAWRDYGVRVGFWRLLEAIDRSGIAVSALLNTDAAIRYPEIVEAGRQRGWAFLGHGRSNSELWTGFDPQDERRALQEVVDVIADATGTAPKGWLGPSLTETENTLDLLSDLGFTYSLDWVSDDHPFPIESTPRPFISVPYSIEINDLPVFLGQSMTPQQFADIIVDQFEVMHEESRSRPGGVFTIAVHPFLVGQPFRHKHFLAALEAISGHDDVWYANSDEIADWYLAHLDETAIDRRSASEQELGHDPT